MGDYDDDDTVTSGNPELDVTMVRQLVHNHQQLAAEKKRMEALFDEVEMDGARKTEELEMYKEKLNAMRRQIKLQEEKAAEVKELKQREDELKEEERAARRRRILPKAPSKRRMSSTGAAKPSVNPVDTAQMDREALVAEIRLLESEMEYLQQEATRHAEENELLRLAVEESHGGPKTHDGVPAGGNLELPDHHVYAMDAFELDHELMVVTVEEGALAAVIHGLGEMYEQAKLAPLLEEQLSVMEAKSGTAEEQVEVLRDAMDELQYELHAARQELASAGGAATGEAASMSLAESFAEAPTADHAIELANKERKIKSLMATLASAKAENEKLESTIAANREVMGMTIEEQMDLLGGRIGLMVELDEARETADEMRGQVLRTQGALEALAMYTSNRDHLVYTLLEKPIKARDRKALLKLLQQTSQETNALGDDANGDGRSTATPADSEGRSGTSAPPPTPLRPSVDDARPPSTPRAATPRAAPAATPFPKELLRKMSDSSLGGAGGAASPNAGATSTPGKPRRPSSATTPTGRPRPTEADVITFVTACCKHQLDKNEPVRWKQLQNAALKKYGQATAAMHMGIILSTAKELAGEKFVTSAE